MLENEKKNNLLFLNWLTLTLLLIFFMIIVGGLTRLTGSGLSITEWELFKGIFPPLNENTWNNYFDLYKKIPQYKLINPNMSLDQFKIIFYWEYFHRILGRIIGLFFLIPFIYFFIIKKINKDFFRPCLLILSLIILQGIVGWYMVSSGLVKDVTVSHYRLSLHLFLAFLIISIIFWLILNLREGTSLIFFSKSLKRTLPVLILVLLVFIQIIFGAFVSGLDAGKIYQTWPLMGQNYFPDDFVFKNFIDMLKFDNHSLVQFYHRNIAYLIIFYVSCLGFLILRDKKKELYTPYFLIFIIVFLQISLGILTLISGLNIYLASAHQICSVFLLFSSINLYYYYIK
tara:strand:+ start:16032 stop:17060 length:1029 start_codon:yes stop_codon:yes gene_type:complete